MKSHLILAALPIINFLFLILVQIVVTRKNEELSPWSVFFRCFFGALLLLVILTSYEARVLNYSYTNLIGYLLTNLLSFVALSFCYFNFINLIYTSLRIRCLKEIFLNKGQMTENEILKNYNSDIMLEQRLIRLVQSNNLCSDEGKFTLGDNDSFNKLGSILGYFKKLLLKVER